MPLNLTISSNTVPANLECVVSNEKWQALIALLSASVNVEISLIIDQHDEPSPASRGQPWLRRNADGSPDRLYKYWNGSWVSPHSLPPGFGGLLYTGLEADIATFDGGEAGAITPISGPFWENVTALGGRFPVGPGSFAGGGSVAIGVTGGEDKHILTIPELPAHRHGLGPLSTVFTGVPSGNIEVNTAPAGVPVTPPPHRVQPFVTDGQDEPHNNLPPYVGTWFLRRTGRLHYRA